MTFNTQGVFWFLAQLKPNSAKIAEKNLKRQGFNTFLPLVEETRQHNKQFINSIRPLFPGYIFVSFDVKKCPWYAINSTYGIIRLVTFDKKPCAVPTDVVTQLMQHFGPKDKIFSSKALMPGDQVKLTNGPFVNFLANIEKVTPNERAWVLMDLMGAQVRIEISTNEMQSMVV
jgi:transcriptional antiterminator RfaH